MEILPQRETFAALRHEAISQQDLNDYRWERDRQERAREDATGGYAGDEELYHDRNGPLITLKDYLKGKGGEQQAWEDTNGGPATREHYEPHESWGGDNWEPPF